MKAVVLAGGVRSGLEVPGSNLPRALWPFPHQPLITHTLAFLKRSGVSEIAICANGKTRLIASQLSDPNSPWLDIHYSEDVLPRGPAGCLRDLEQWLTADGSAEPFIAIQGTASYDFDLQAMIAEHQKTGAAITVGARRCPDDVDLLEPAGVYIVDPKTLPLIQQQGYQDFKEQFLPKVIAHGMLVRCHSLKGTATLIHSPGHYLSALREAIVRFACPDQLPAGYRTLGDNIVLHESATIDPAARLSGPIWIDQNATVAAGAVLSGPVVLGPNTSVGSGALLHRTVAMANTTIAPHAEVFSAILPPHSHRAAPAPRKVSRHPKDAARESTPSASPSRNPLNRIFTFFEPAR